MPKSPELSSSENKKHTVSEVMLPEGISDDSFTKMLAQLWRLLSVWNITASVDTTYKTASDRPTKARILLTDKENQPPQLTDDQIEILQREIAGLTIKPTSRP